MTTNRILTTLVQLILAGVTIPLFILMVRDLKHDLKNLEQFNFQLIPTRPTAAALSEMSVLRLYDDTPEIRVIFNTIGLCDYYHTL